MQQQFQNSASLNTATQFDRQPKSAKGVSSLQSAHTTQYIEGINILTFMIRLANVNKLAPQNTAGYVG